MKQLGDAMLSFFAEREAEMTNPPQRDTLDINALMGDRAYLSPYWEIWDEDEIVLDGHFTYAALKAIMDAWEEYRAEQEKAAT